jgi:hypothetical protein
MIVKVHMLAFCDKGTVREVEIADGFYSLSVKEVLAEVFGMGQNDLQPKQMPSVSTGDVIEYENQYWEIKAFRFNLIGKERFEELKGA